MLVTPTGVFVAYELIRSVPLLERAQSALTMVGRRSACICNPAAADGGDLLAKKKSLHRYWHESVTFQPSLRRLGGTSALAI